MEKKYKLDLGLPEHPSRKPIEYKIDENDCWICISHCGNGGGYPQTQINGKLFYLSRLIYTFYHGELNNFFCCHKCDNPACINPDHLFAGTFADNMRDMAIKERSQSTKLTAINILYIRSSGLSLSRLAKKFGVTKKTICNIKLGKSWQHLPGKRLKYKKPGVRGENHGNAKLTGDQVLKIRKLYNSGKYTQSRLAEIFKISRSHISKIISKKNWTHCKQ